ncbi:hypothetical protein [Novipirellula aureliae]|uniref:hypothetical protein n=1 Tax=Novipirellula aureliae TaxID=2527966 RepID=UPI0011B51863|nr:hypothetical protein [Novipirellula aureliae]
MVIGSVWGIDEKLGTQNFKDELCSRIGAESVWSSTASVTHSSRFGVNLIVVDRSETEQQPIDKK